MIDAVFNAYFQVVPYGFFMLALAANIIIQFFYIFTSRWDIS
jgi:hypothetical protein